jgi:hypothetical protein
MSQLNAMKILKKWQSKLQLTGKESKSPSPDDVDLDTQAILAFRTITTMLSTIQSPTKIASTVVQRLPNEQRRELRVLDALSAVAVRQHEIVAVTAKSYGGANVEVLMSVNILEPALNIYQHSGAQSTWNALRWFRITPNPRDSAKNLKDKIDSLTIKTSSSGKSSMKLVDPSATVSLELSEAGKVSNDKLLATFLQTEWWVFWRFPTV